MAKFYPAASTGGAAGSSVTVSSTVITPQTEGEIWFRPSTGETFVAVERPKNLVPDPEFSQNFKYWAPQNLYPASSTQYEDMESVFFYNYVQRFGDDSTNLTLSNGTRKFLAMQTDDAYVASIAPRPGPRDFWSGGFSADSGQEYTISFIIGNAVFGHTLKVDAYSGNMPGMWGPTRLSTTSINIGANQERHTATFTANGNYIYFRLVNEMGPYVVVEVSDIRLCKTSDLNVQELAWADIS